MSNNLLTDKLYLQSLGFKDTYYLESLCQSLWEFIKNTPVFVFSNVYKDKQDGVIKIKLSVGENNVIYNIENDIHVFDFIYRFQKNFLTAYYPQFKFEEEIDSELDVDDMLRIVANNDVSLNDAVFLKKKIKVEQSGIILKVFLVRDEFLLEHNGVKSIRTTAFSDNIKTVLPVNTFIKNARNIYYNTKDGKDVRDYIMDNSKELRILSKTESDIVVDYPGNMMKSFFRIHFPDLQNYSLDKITHLYYQWGKYCIMFPDEIVENDCIAYYRKRKNPKDNQSGE